MRMDGKVLLFCRGGYLYWFAADWRYSALSWQVLPAFNSQAIRRSSVNQFMVTMTRNSVSDIVAACEAVLLTPKAAPSLEAFLAEHSVSSISMYVRRSGNHTHHYDML